MNQCRRSRFELPLALLREAVAHSKLLPDAYARYRPLLADALHFFLERLPAARLGPLLSEQALLPAKASTAQRVVSLLRHSPALHKLGQVVARDHRLPPAFRNHLQQLESMAPRLASADVLRLLDQALPQWRKTGVVLDPEPLAEGSVAVLMPFALGPPRPRPAATTTAFRSPSPRRGVFKLLKPGIHGLLEQDLHILGELGGFLDEDCPRYHLPALDYRETFQTIRRLLVHEVRLRGEQQHLAEAARLYQGSDAVAIPALLPFCSDKVTAMERLPGTKLAETAAATPSIRRRVAGALAHALVGAPLFSPRPAALFHADPHAGNLLLSPDGRIGLLDWSLVGRLRKEERVAFVQLVVGALELDAAAMAAAVRQLAVRPPEPALLESILQESLRELRWGVGPGLGWLAGLFDRLVVRAALRLSPQWLLFRKALLTLEGVLADFTHGAARDAWAVLDQAVLGAFLQHWAEEWPRRATASFSTRSFGTHLANRDLVALLCATPATAARWWTQTGLDLLQAASRVMISTTRFSSRGAASENAR